MKILSAIDYGDRKVIVVHVNDNEDDWTHPEDRGDAHSAANARKADVRDSSRTRTRGDLDPLLEAGTGCHACHDNRVIHEFVYLGADLGKTDQELKDMAMASADVAEPVVRDMLE